MPVNLLVIEDQTLKAMLVDPRLMALIPCLEGPKQQLAKIQPGGKDCRKCESQKRQAAKNAMLTAKQCLVALRGAKLGEVKAILGTNQLRLYLKNASGKRVEHTL